MIALDIRERLRREPFQPFVIRSSSGVGVRVASADLAVLMKSAVFVAEPNSDRWTHLSYLHIAGLESGGAGGRGRGPSRREKR
jgi:hypothetical protein